MKLLNYIISKHSPGAILIQETKVKLPIDLQDDKYEVFEKVIDSEGGGGIMIAVKTDFEPNEAFKGEEDLELLGVNITIDKQEVLLITGYGPQEDDKEDKKDLFWRKLSQEVSNAKERAVPVIIEIYVNAKLDLTDNKH